MPNRKSKEYIEKIVAPIIDQINNPDFESCDDMLVELSVSFGYLAEELFENKQYTEIADVFFKIVRELTDYDEYFYTYETAYSLAQVNELDNAEMMCEYLEDINQYDQGMLNKIYELKKIIKNKKMSKE